MDDLDDLLDEFDSPQAKTSTKRSGAPQSSTGWGGGGYGSKKEPQMDDKDEFEDLLDDMLGPDETSNKKYSKAKKTYGSAQPSADFIGVSEESKYAADDGWGGSTGGFATGSASGAPKKAKKGDK